MNDITVNKVSVKKDGKIVVEYALARDDDRGTDENVIGSYDQALPEFYDAVKALVPDMLAWIEAKDDPDLYTVTGVTMKQIDMGDYSALGAVIVAQKKLAYCKAPLNIVTPWKVSEVGEHGDADCCLTRECLSHLDDLAREATRYVHGERLQGDLFSEMTEAELQAATA
jgi:hypothetical protein